MQQNYFFEKMVGNHVPKPIYKKRSNNSNSTHSSFIYNKCFYLIFVYSLKKNKQKGYIPMFGFISLAVVTFLINFVYKNYY